jgi:hypothetical protein
MLSRASSVGAIPDGRIETPANRPISKPGSTLAARHTPRNRNFLFPGEAHPINKENMADKAKHQFKVENNVEHADAFKDGTIQSAVFEFVQQSINRAVAELSGGTK